MDMYSYMQLDENTIEVLHSGVYEENGDQKVLVQFIRGNDFAECVLPSYDWQTCEGFDEAKIGEFELFLRDQAYWIYEFAKQ